MYILPRCKILICQERLNVPTSEKIAIISADFRHETYRL